MKPFFTFLLLYTGLFINAQTIADFENLSVPQDSFLNGSDGNGGYHSGNVFFPNAYNDAWESWVGWSISNKTDVTTAGPMNQYSAITGSGFESSNYAVGFVSGTNILIPENQAAGERFEGLYVTNGTYPYFSMLNGDGFAKKFGGATGNDPDFFLLTIKKYLNGNLSTDSIDFYLADYRFSNNSEDYLVNEWTYLDLTSLGKVDSLQFTLSSSDTGMFGMNTPGYFCIDNVTTSDGTTDTETFARKSTPIVFPNPVADFIYIEKPESQSATFTIYDLLGNPIKYGECNNTTTQVGVRDMESGSYIIQVQDGKEQISKLFVKL